MPKVSKVQIFAADDASYIQDLVNRFIADKMVIDIQYQSLLYSTEFTNNGTPKNYFVNDRVMIWYEEDEK